MSVRVHKLAKELGFSSKELIVKLRELSVSVKGHMSVIDDETAEILRHELEEASKKKRKEVEKIKRKDFKEIEVIYPLTVKNLAIKLQIKPNELIGKLIKLNIFANINQTIDKDVCEKIAEPYKVELKEKLSDEQELIQLHEVKENSKKRVHRAPVVTMMGHVDHGKTLLLDAIRKANVVDGEAGGITQHIGAYEVDFSGHDITFLDTPGHEAFTAMRARGAHVTDIVVLVVAADDGVMPQTIEAIDHAKAAKVPIIVAINKVDKPNINVDKVKNQLQELNLTPEEWGGEIICVCVSAKTGEGIEHLLEMVLLQAEILELKADPDTYASGTIVEAKICKGSGVVATALVQSGTLKLQDIVVTGLHYARVKAMINDHGKRINKAGPSAPVEILGFSGVPEAGDTFYVVDEEKKARSIVEKRRHKKREKDLMPQARALTLEDLSKEIQKGKIKILNVIIKTDVQGSLEALCASLNKIESEEVELNLVHKGVGNINESDVMLAVVSGAVIIGFGVGKDVKASETAKSKGVEIKLYSVIYEAISDIRSAMEGLLEPHIKRSLEGRAEVRQVFKVSKVGTIAGCMVVKGAIVRGMESKIIREDENIFTGTVDSLKRFKNDVKEVKEGFECGIGFRNFNNIKAGDLIEVFKLEKIKKTL
ncbi:MAG: translation initiation factor IF-2 [Candidatus Omnitrophica bacterium]|nr:translation initiation factor IF-2 [Candidatus Omnitrophota bacterium]